MIELLVVIGSVHPVSLLGHGNHGIGSGSREDLLEKPLRLRGLLRGRGGSLGGGSGDRGDFDVVVRGQSVIF